MMHWVLTIAAAVGVGMAAMQPVQCDHQAGTTWLGRVCTQDVHEQCPHDWAEDEEGCNGSGCSGGAVPDCPCSGGLAMLAVDPLAGSIGDMGVLGRVRIGGLVYVGRFLRPASPPPRMG